MPSVEGSVGSSASAASSFTRLYSWALCEDTAATLDDLREAVSKLEELERTAKRVLGGAHPLTTAMEDNLRQARAKLRAREDAEPDVSAEEIDAAEAAVAAAAGDGSG